jgi:hypothetical protein
VLAPFGPVGLPSYLIPPPDENFPTRVSFHQFESWELVRNHGTDPLSLIGPVLDHEAAGFGTIARPGEEDGRLACLGAFDRQVEIPQLLIDPSGEVFF